MATKALVALVGLGHHGHGVPAYIGGNIAGNKGIPGNLLLLFRRNRIAVGCQDTGRSHHPLGACFGGQLLEKIVSLITALMFNYTLERIQPVLGFLRIWIFIIRTHNVPRM